MGTKQPLIIDFTKTWIFDGFDSSVFAGLEPYAPESAWPRRKEFTCGCC